MALFRKGKPSPQIGREKPDAPMMPFLPELPEDDLLVDDKTWEASQGWHGPEAQQAAQQATKNARTTAVQTQQRISNDWVLAQRTSKAESAPCGQCGQAVDRADAKMNVGDPWRYCPTCWQMLYREPETSRRRLACTRALIDLPDDIVPADMEGTIFRYFAELPAKSPTGEAVEPWSWVRLDTLRDQIVDNHRIRFMARRAPGEFSGRMCGGCGILLAVQWSNESVPVMRPGHEDDPRLPLCFDCGEILYACGGDPHSDSWADRLFWRALGFDLSRPEADWANAHGFVPYARVFADASPEYHDFTRRFGWIEQADLDAVRDSLLTKVPNRSADHATQARYQRRQTMARLRSHQRVEPVPEPVFSVTPTAPPKDRSPW